MATKGGTAGRRRNPVPSESRTGPRAEPDLEQGVPRSEEHLQLRQTRWDGNLQCVNLDYDPDPRFVGESASDLEEKSKTAFG